MKDLELSPLTVSHLAEIRQHTICVVTRKGWWIVACQEEQVLRRSEVKTRKSIVPLVRNENIAEIKGPELNTRSIEEAAGHWLQVRNTESVPHTDGSQAGRYIN